LHLLRDVARQRAAAQTRIEQADLRQERDRDAGDVTMSEAAVVAVDVGTGSARAGVFSPDGRMLARAEHPIALNRPRPDHAEQSSDDIWSAIAAAVREARAAARVTGEAVAGISFDATCSLVALDEWDRPASVSTTGEDRWNVVAWLDHRAIAEAEACTASGHSVLDWLGGTMSPEMEIPKLMWLKRTRPEAWRRYRRILDLADFLAFRACGSNARSCCTLTCKWTYLAHQEPGWQDDFLALVGLADLGARTAVPAHASSIGAPLGRLTEVAAADLGLTTNCTVGCGLVDAHAGTLGVLGQALGRGGAELDRNLALIAGTSTGHMALSAAPRRVKGVWGPYRDAVAPGLWLNEGGQSATGGLLDHLLEWHAKGAALGPRGHAVVLERIAALRAEEGQAFADRLMVLPDFHGNRSPLAEPDALGVISGLSLDASLDSLARLYFAAAVGIALGTRHILDALNAVGYTIDRLHVAGGHTRNPLLMELYADVTGCAVTAPADGTDAVLLGTAMVAAAAAGLHPDLRAAAAAMARAGTTRQPNPARRDGYARRYRAFLHMHEHRRMLERMLGHDT
jgi:FGGY-family pentulose kinase